MSVAAFGTAPRPRPSNGARSSIDTTATAKSSKLAGGSSRVGRMSQAGGVSRQSDPVRAAQDEATRVWREDLRVLLSRAETHFADICWTTATTNPSDGSNDDDVFSSDAESIAVPSIRTGSVKSGRSLGQSITPNAPETLIWAHKAILYARAPNTFQTRFLQLRTPAAQLEHLGSTASLVSLPLATQSQLSLHTNTTTVDSRSTTPVNDATALAPGSKPKVRKSIRGLAPPSSFSLKKSSARKSVSGSSISRPFRNGSVDDASSFAAGFITSDSENESAASHITHGSISRSFRGYSAGKSSSSHATHSSAGQERLVPTRKPSFASSNARASQLTDNSSIISVASTIRAPLRLAGTNQAFFEATLAYLYTGEETMMDAFDFLFEDRLANDADKSPEERLEKLRSDLTFMWRSKLYSDVKIALDDGASSHGGADNRDMDSLVVDIPDDNRSLLSVAPTMDTDRIDESDTEEDDEVTSFSTHRMILASRSPYFASMLLSPYTDAVSPVLSLPSPPFTPASLHFTLGFLYTGTLFFSNRTFDLSTAFSLWRAGAYLQIETLQTLVCALVDREFCHGFACSPPCRKCIKRVPRTLAFSASPDVNEPKLQEPAMDAVSGLDFGTYWAKDVGNLDPMLQDRIVDTISQRLKDDPSQVVSVLRQLSIVGAKIDTERASRWVESLRLMAETVENRLMPILHDHLEQIVLSKAWSDLLDGVGSLGDVLEKALVMLLDGLTEARAAKIYEILVGQVLLRDQGFEVVGSRQAVENARVGILRYLKKRWINVRALGGFNRLPKWCLKEIADELDVSSADLILPDEQKTPVPSSAANSAARNRLLRAASSPGSAGGTPRASLPATSSRLRTTSTTSTATTSSVFSGPASPSPRSRIASPTTLSSPSLGNDSNQDEETEREAGPINLRAAVLNRNAARVSVVNGHRSSISPSASGHPSASATSVSKSTPMRTAAPDRASSMSPASRRSPSASLASTSTTPAKAESSALKADEPISSPSTIAIPLRSRTNSDQSTKTVKSAKSARSLTAKVADSTNSRSSSASKAMPPPPLPSSAGPGTGTSTTTGTVRTLKKASSASLNKVRTVSKSGTDSKTSTSTAAAASAAEGATSKPSFLRATPGPGGTFSLSTTDSGRDIRARKLSTGKSTRSPSSTGTGTGTARQRQPSTTPTRSPRLSKSSEFINKGAIKPDAAESVTEASDEKCLRTPSGLPPSDSAATITPAAAHSPCYPPDEDSREPASLGISLNCGIPCIVSPHAPMAMGASVQADDDEGSRPTSRSLARVSRFKAEVRYIGLLAGRRGMWVGIQVSVQACDPEILEAGLGTPTNGCLHGKRYFDLHPTSGQLKESDIRKSRRLHVLDQIDAVSSPLRIESRPQSAASDLHPENSQQLVGYFVRPSDILFVVGSY
ncbi:hypothetical protein BCV70DRAFT_161513 [Testicularia cyperi]|uniref:BTB domain-containing protein n=1 Tax=Testicularia cyperi TaxID=1882483 RepID=A0A317XQ27_9BASI|nr:hypothetical protein BCV70DRAFT_161513 [Testicularia cyperi]